MEFIKDLKQWREDRNLIEPQWDSIVGSLLEENQELKEAYDNNDYHEVIDAYADHSVFITNLLGQLEVKNIFPDNESIDNEVKSVGEINLLIKLLKSILEAKQYLLATYLLKVINWSCKVDIEHLSYNFESVMKETVKEIGSRQQDPEQKAKWEQSGSNGEKWQKNRSQDPSTLYKADYSKCKK